jgi:hypothetical protein
MDAINEETGPQAVKGEQPNVLLSFSAKEDELNAYLLYTRDQTSGGPKITNLGIPNGNSMKTSL